MILIEVQVAGGILSITDKIRLAQRLGDDWLTISDATEATLGTVGSWTRVLVTEPDVCWQGGNVVASGTAPQFLVQVTVPGPWRKEMSGTIIERFTAILAEFHPHPQRLYERPDAWVHVGGVAEGSLGVFGRILPSQELAELMATPFRQSADRDAIVVAAAPGTAVDPSCGGSCRLPPRTR